MNSRTRRTTISLIWVTGGRSKETPRYFAGITEATPRQPGPGDDPLAALAGARDVLGPEDPAGAVADAERAGSSVAGVAARAGSTQPSSAKPVDRRALAGGLLDRLLLAGARSANFG